MNKATFIDEVYAITKAYDPDVKDLSYEDCIELLKKIKEKAMRWEIHSSSFKPEPELFPVRHTLEEARARQASLKETQARQAAMRQGQL